MTLLPISDDWTIIDCQATPSGYYEIAFREKATGNTIVATQHGRGGSNLYSYPPDHPVFKPFEEWLATSQDIAISYLNHIGFPDLAGMIKDRESEWVDTAVMCFVDWVEMKKVRVAG